MKVLLVKLSSLGDVIHTLPALTDAAAALPDVSFDWVIEEAFAEVPSWHPAVDRIVPVGLRRGRRNPIKYFRSEQWHAARKTIREAKYDLVIDAQGLLKSAFIASLANAPRIGMDKHSVRERLAATTYDEVVAVPRNLHAVERTRLLFAQALSYKLPESSANFGLGEMQVGEWLAGSGRRGTRVAFIHGTSRRDKLWPQARWCELAMRAASAGWQVTLPWGTDAEKLRAELIKAASGSSSVTVLTKTSLTVLASELGQCSAVVSVDTGPAHLAAALGVPGVALYGVTQPDLVGTYGENQQHVCALGSSQSARTVQAEPMQTISTQTVWRALQSIIQKSGDTTVTAEQSAANTGK